MSLYDICSGVIVNRNIKVSSIKHLELGETLMLDKFILHSKKITDEYLYQVYNKYDLDYSYEFCKLSRMDENMNKKLSKFGVNMKNLIDGNTSDLNSKVEFNNCTPTSRWIKKPDKITSEFHANGYESSIIRRSWVVNDTIIEQVSTVICNRDEDIISCSIKKSIFFTLKYSKYIYALFYTGSKDGSGPSDTLLLRKQYSRVVSSLIDL